MNFGLYGSVVTEDKRQAIASVREHGFSTPALTPRTPPGPLPSFCVNPGGRETASS
ncbi:hypothetical protein [Phormidium sp. CCY1219]|uniref:hypothetical protein n=1 Tax=Phormidium sp. CCY1219 TaxID=2886104 RepID=UPI002D1F7896|nr:hypothetical protein [Phormidium sp. CCY1219]MEB3829019.1 hypothetical protein [Phormidium sp. CCY1219]